MGTPNDSGLLAVDPADLRLIFRHLDTAGSDVYDSAAKLNVTPNAGSSSDELVAAIRALAAATAGVGNKIGERAAGVARAAGDYANIDDLNAAAIARLEKREHQ